MQKLQSDVMPVQQANSELSEKTGMLQAEKKILEEEIKRWRNRTQVGGPSGSIGPRLEADSASSKHTRQRASCLYHDPNKKYNRNVILLI